MDLKKETAQSLLEFFESLDTGEPASESQISYASPGVVQRGLEACRRLVEQQEGGGEPAEEQAEPSAPAEAADSGELLRVKEELEAARSRNGELKKQNEKLEGDVERLRSHIQMLQRQMDRMHDRRELSSTLDQIESSSPEAKEQRATEREQEPDKKQGEGVLHESFESESAMPVRDLEDEVTGGEATEEAEDEEKS